MSSQTTAPQHALGDIVATPWHAVDMGKLMNNGGDHLPGIRILNHTDRDIASDRHTRIGPAGIETQKDAGIIEDFIKSPSPRKPSETIVTGLHSPHLSPENKEGVVQTFSIAPLGGIGIPTGSIAECARSGMSITTRMNCRHKAPSSRRAQIRE